MRPLTRSCFLLLSLKRLFLLALSFLHRICPFSLWSPLFSLHVPALIIHSFAKVRLSLSLTLSHLTIWCFGLTALLLLATVAPAYLPTALCVALRPLFSFQQAQYVQVFLLKPAPFCTLFSGLGSTNKPAISPLLLSESRSVLATLSSPPLFLYLKLFGRSGRNCLLTPPVLSGYNGSPDTHFSRGTTRLMSWPDGESYLRPLQFLVISLLLSVVSTLYLFSDWRRTVSSKFFDTQVPSISTEELVLPRHTRCVRSHLRSNGHSLLLSSYFS